MNYLTPLELEALELLEDINIFFDSVGVHFQKRGLYVRTRGRIRDLITKLENRKFGCATGKHSGPCKC